MFDLELNFQLAFGILDNMTLEKQNHMLPLEFIKAG